MTSGHSRKRQFVVKIKPSMPLLFFSSHTFSQKLFPLPWTWLPFCWVCTNAKHCFMKHCTQLSNAFSSNTAVEVIMERVISTACKLIIFEPLSMLKGHRFSFKQKGLRRKGNDNFDTFLSFFVKLDEQICILRVRTSFTWGRFIVSSTKGKSYF